MTRMQAFMGVTRMSTPAVGAAGLLLPLLLCGLAARPAGAEPSGSSITLEWTSPGDDGAIGNANSYDIRYSLAPITRSNFVLATPATGLPNPAKPGKKEKVKVKGLLPDQRYYFALKTVDDNGNWSGLSNVVAQTAPAGVAELQFPLMLSAPRPNPARVSANFVLTLPKEASVRLLVIDAGGRVVRTLLDETRPAGQTPIEWNLHDLWGRRLSPGTYWITANLGNRQLAERITVVP